MDSRKSLIVVQTQLVLVCGKLALQKRVGKEPEVSMQPILLTTLKKHYSPCCIFIEGQLRLQVVASY